MTYYRSVSGLAHRAGNLRRGITACGHHLVSDLVPFDGAPTTMRCWACYRTVAC